MDSLTYRSIRWAIILLLGLQILKADSFEGWTPEEVQQFHAHYKVKAEEYRLKAQRGDIDAQIKLGVLYHEGRGLTKDFVQAVFWYRKAANQGDARAQWILANRYHRGEGVSKDDVEAYAYWNLSGVTLEEGRTEVAELEKKLSRDEIVAGQKRTRELKAEIAANVAAKPLAVAGAIEAVASKVSEVADSKHIGTPAGEQPKGSLLLWAIFFLLLLVVIAFVVLVAVLAYKKAALVARAKASGDSHADVKPTHGFLYYWGLSSLAILAILSALGYLNGGASGFYYQLGRGLIMAPLGGLVVGGIWKMLSK